MRKCFDFCDIKKVTFSVEKGNSLSQLMLTAPSEREPCALLAEEGGISQREMSGGVAQIQNSKKAIGNDCFFAYMRQFDCRYVSCAMVSMTVS